MKILETLGEFFLVEWMWSVSWGISQAPIACFLLMIFLWFGTPFSFIRSVLSALLVTVLSFLIFSACIMLGLAILAYTPAPYTYDYVLSGVHWESYIGFGLAGIFSLLEILFFHRIHVYARISMMRISIFVIMSNLIAACLTRAFLLTS